MASYCLTVTRLRVRKRYFTRSEYVNTSPSSTCVTTDTSCRAVKSALLKFDGGRLNVEECASRVTVSSVDAGQRRILTVIKYFHPHGDRYHRVCPLIAVTGSVDVQRTVARTALGALVFAR